MPEMMRAPKPVLLTGGRILDPSQNLDERGDLLVLNGKVEAIGRVERPDDADVVDCSDCIVSPGFIDVHCHLREPGREDVILAIAAAYEAASRRRVPPPAFAI